jgi:hypothetical protein
MIRPLVVGLLLLVIPGRDAGPGSSLRAQDAMAEALAVERPKAVEGRSAAERDDLDAIYERAGGRCAVDRRGPAADRAGTRRPQAPG